MPDQVTAAIWALYGDSGITCAQTLSERDPGEATVALFAWLDLAKTVATINGAQHLFDISGGSPLPQTPTGLNALSLMATGASHSYAGGLLPLLIESMQAARRPYGYSPAGVDEYTLYMDSIWPSGLGHDLGFDDEVLSSFTLALVHLTSTDPENALPLLRDLTSSDLFTAQVTSAIALASAHPDLSEFAVEWAQDPKVRGLPRDLNSSWAWGGVLARIISIGSPEQRLAVVALALGSYPDVDLAAARRWKDAEVDERQDGDWTEFARVVEQSVALSFVVEAWNESGDPVPESLAARFVEVEAIAGRRPESLRPSAGGGVVGSPLSDDAVAAYSDEDWLVVFTEIVNDEIEWRESGPVGGVGQVAQQLRSHVKEDPLRFTQLLRRAGPDVHERYVDAVLWGISESVAPFTDEQVGDIFDLFREVSSWSESRQGFLCQAIASFSHQDIPADIVGIVATVATQATDPTGEVWQERGASGDYLYGGDILSAGLNCPRGYAVTVIARLLSDSNFGEPRLAQVRDALLLIADDPVEQVRVMLTEVIAQLLYRDRELASLLMSRWLQSASNDSLVAREIVHISYVLWLDEDPIGINVATRLLGSEDESVALSAGILIASMAWREQQDERRSDESLQLFDSAFARAESRVGIAQTLSDLVDEIPKDLETAEGRPEVQIGWRTLVRLLDDEVESVRNAAGRFAFNLKQDLSVYEALLVKISALEHFGELAYSIFHSLTRHEDQIPQTAIILIEVWLSNYGHLGASMANKEAGTVMFVSEVLLSLHASTDDPELRVRILNQIDRMIDLGINEVARSVERA